MASNHTEHFSLNQWQADDQVLRTDFNEDNAKIDSALKDLAAAQAEKADQSALDALAAEVAKKAATAALDALSKKLASMPCLVTGTYTGDGAESRLISLGFQPKAPAPIPMTTTAAWPCRGSRYACKPAMGPIIF